MSVFEDIKNGLLQAITFEKERKAIRSHFERSKKDIKDGRVLLAEEAIEMINKIHFFLLDEIFLLLLKDVLAILPPYQTVYLGTKHITIKDLADKDLIRPRIFNLICNAMAIRRFGLGAISITAERKTKS